MRTPHFSESDEAALQARLEDWIDQCRTRRKPVRSCFLSPAQQAFLTPFLPWDLAYRWDGGCAEAERKKLILAPEEDACVSDIVCLTARISDKFVQVKHPDVLGALMNLDLDRSQFGDLWVEPGRIVIYTSEELADYVCMNLTRIHKLSIRLERSSMMYEPVVKKQVLTVIVTALRLDCVIAGLCRMSRAKAQDWIRAQKVSVNHKILDECDFLCHNEDTISVRGYGRFVLKGQRGQTRSDRIVAEFEKYV